MAYSFADATGGVYTINYADFSHRVPPQLRATRTAPTTRPLITGAMSALTQSPPSAATAAAGQFVNMHEFERYWALMVLTGHWGGWPYAPDPEPVGANARHLRRPDQQAALLHPPGDQRRLLDRRLRLHRHAEVDAGQGLRPRRRRASRTSAAQLNGDRREGPAAQLGGRGGAGVGADRLLRPDGHQEALQRRRRGDVPAAGRLLHERPERTTSAKYLVAPGRRRRPERSA